MTINGKVHCFFEQSGTFKREFIKLGIPAEDYDIQNNFGETDHTDDLFKEIEDAWDGKPSLFDSIGKDDLIFAFFPCIYFCDAKGLFFRGQHISQKKWSIDKIMRFNIEQAEIREHFFKTMMKLFSVVDSRGLRMVVENPWNASGQTYLQNNFISPTIVDKNRMTRGDYFVKPTGYWFVGCQPTSGLFSAQNDKEQRIVDKMKNGIRKGVCSDERSMISPDYARNFICDFILGGGNPYIPSQPDLFDEAAKEAHE